MTAKATVLTLVVTAVGIVVAMEVYGISLASAIALAPVFVISAGLVAGLGLIWFRAARDNLRGR